MKAVSWANECRTESAKESCEQSLGRRSKEEKHPLLDRHCFQVLCSWNSSKERVFGTPKVEGPGSACQRWSLGSHRVQGLQEDLAAGSWLCSGDLSCLDLCRAP